MKGNLLVFFEQHKEVYVFGCNEDHRILAKYFEKNGKKITGFVVSNARDNQEDVYKISDIKPKGGGNVGIIVAVLDKYYNEIIPELVRDGFKVEDIYFFDLAERNIVYSLYGNRIEYEYEEFVNIKNEYFKYSMDIIKMCDERFYYMFCVHFNLGDLVQVFQLRKRFEDKYKSKLYFLISKNQIPVADICHLKNYIVVDGIDTANYSIDTSHLNMLNIHLFETIFMNMPIKGVPFVIPFLIKFRNLLNEDNFSKHFSEWLSLDNEPVETPGTLKVSASLIKKLGDIKPDKIVLIAPEAKSMKSLDVPFFSELVNKERDEGNTVVVNSSLESYQIPDTVKLDLSLRELLELAGNCFRVHSVRSGFCDCIAGMKGELYVYYWNNRDLKYFSLCNNYIGYGNKINEILVHGD